MSRKVRIELVFTADLDDFPRWGHQPCDWVSLVERELTHNHHYHPEVKILSVKESSHANPNLFVGSVVPVPTVGCGSQRPVHLLRSQAGNAEAS